MGVSNPKSQVKQTNINMELSKVKMKNTVNRVKSKLTVLDINYKVLLNMTKKFSIVLNMIFYVI